MSTTLSLLFVALVCEVSIGYSSALQSVIIDTDIGSFYDDFMALALAVKSPSLDVKLVVTCTDDTTARAKVAAKLLNLFGRSDIPIGIGVQNENVTKHPLFGWAQDFDLNTYKGGVFQDGVAGIANVIDKSSSTVDILCIGPMTNFPELLKRYPEVVHKARIKVSGGSIYKGYYNSSTAVEEYNIKTCPGCASQVFHAGWTISLAPLDTTGLGDLTPTNMRTFLESVNAVALAVGNSLVYYCSNNPYGDWKMQCTFKVSTPVLYDAVATLLTLQEASNVLEFQKLNITVTSDGYTVIDNKTGVPMEVAIHWSENDGLRRYREFLTDTLASVC